MNKEDQKIVRKFWLMIKGRRKGELTGTLSSLIQPMLIEYFQDRLFILNNYYAMDRFLINKPGLLIKHGSAMYTVNKKAFKKWVLRNARKLVYRSAAVSGLVNRTNQMQLLG